MGHLGPFEWNDNRYGSCVGSNPGALANSEAGCGAADLSRCCGSGTKGCGDVAELSDSSPSHTGS